MANINMKIVPKMFTVEQNKAHKIFVLTLIMPLERESDSM